MQKPNGLNWETVTLHALGAEIADGNSGAFDLGDWVQGIFVFNLTAAATEAGDTFNLMVDVSYDGGVTYSTAGRFTEALGNGGVQREAMQLGGAYVPPAAVIVDINTDPASAAVRPMLVAPTVRARWEIVDVATADNQSFTFELLAYIR